MKFIVLTTQRSGSNLLRTYLNSHPNLKCEDELAFNKNAAILSLQGKVDGLQTVSLDESYYSKTRKKRYLLSYSEEFPVNYYNQIPDHHGFIIHYNQINSDIDLSQFNIIHLVRKNLFERAFSVYEILEGLRDTNNAFDRKKEVKVKKRKLRKIIKDSKHDLKFWINRLKGIPHLEIEYSELFNYEEMAVIGDSKSRKIEMPVTTIEKICSYLNIDECNMNSSSKRRNSPNYKEYIKNWKEISSLKAKYSSVDI